MPERIYRLRRYLEDYTPRQIDDIPLNVLPSPYDARDYLYSKLKPLMPFDQLPDETFNRERIPLRVDQGKYGTCTAVSSVNGFKAFQELIQGDYPAAGLSAAFVYDVSKNIDGIPNEAGTYLRVTMKVLKDYGVCPEADYSYSVITSDINRPMPPQVAFEKAKKYQIASYAQIASVADKDRSKLVETIYNALVNEGPLEIAVIVTESFLDVKGPDYVIPPPAGRILGAHAMRLVDGSKRRRAFLTPNTWGGRWGNNDLAWLPWDWLTLTFDPLGDGRYSQYYFMECWTATDVVIPQAAKKIELTVGNKTAVVDDLQVLIDQEPFITNKGRTMVPLRFLGGNMGYIVQYIAETNKVILTRPN